MFSKDLREKIREAYSRLKNYRQVGRNFGISHQTVKYIVENHDNDNKKKRGPKSKVNRHYETAIKREIRKANAEGRKISSKDIQENCDLGHISDRTIRRTIARIGFKYNKVKQSLVLTKNHRLRRLELAKRWLEESHPWNLTCFTDEKKFNLDGPDNWATWMDEGRKIYRNKRQLGGGSVMVWGILFPDGYLHLEKIEGILNADKYLELLAKIIPKLDREFGRGEYYFQQDNASVHTAKKVKDYIETEGIKVLDWPARSPDLNIIENIWKMISDIIYAGRQFQNKHELWAAIRDASEDISENKKVQTGNLYRDMTKRLVEVIQAKGGPIKR